MDPDKENCGIPEKFVHTPPIPPTTKKYDLHAVQVMGANNELWQYKIYENGIFQLEEVHSRTGSGMAENTGIKDGKNPVMVEAGRKRRSIYQSMLTSYGEEDFTL